jgi:transcription initiation factor TFIID subunit 12
VDDFVESVTTFACNLAKHRKSNILEVKDVQLHLERNWNIRVPGYYGDSKNSRGTLSDAHKQKLELVKKAQQAAKKQ